MSVWDLNYTAIDGAVTSVTKAKSNGTVSGIASMLMSEMFPYSYALSETLVSSAFASAANLDDLIVGMTRGMARNYIAPIGSQSTSRSALSVQTRVTKIVSRVPKIALWLLVSTNILYTILAISLAILALLVASPDTYQLRIRLSGVGLAAQLFEGAFSERAVKNEKELFENQGKGLDEKRVKVSNIQRQGTAFEVIK
jgi:hypothetical protein